MAHAKDSSPTSSIATNASTAEEDCTSNPINTDNRASILLEEALLSTPADEVPKPAAPVCTCNQLKIHSTQTPPGRIFRRYHRKWCALRKGSATSVFSASKFPELRIITLQQALHRREEEKVCEEKATTDVLPDDILLKIFSFLLERDLCRLSLVCKRFNTIANDFRLWRGLYQLAYGKYFMPVCKANERKQDLPLNVNLWKESFRQLYPGTSRSHLLRGRAPSKHL